MDQPAASSPASTFLSLVSMAHGLYYAVTGFWPVIEIRSFQWVTGPKRDLWLVKTAGALIGVIGLALALAGKQKRTSEEMQVLAAGAAVSLASIDVVYYRRGILRPIYLLDAAGELGLALAWIVGSVLQRRTRR